MNDVPMVSVVIPVFNSESTVEKTLLSVLKQSYDLIEIIVVDDGSTDGTKEVVKNIFDRDVAETSRCFYFFQENAGVAAARNKGARAASGKYIAFLDSDDQWYQDKLKLQVQYHEKNPEVLLTGGGWGQFSKDCVSVDYGAFETMDITLFRQLFKNRLLPSTILLKKTDYVISGGFVDGMRYAEEGDLFFKLTGLGVVKLICLNMVMYGDNKPGFGASGLSANLVEMEKGELRNLYLCKKRKDIGFFVFLIALVYSVIKFFRRLTISYFRGRR